MRNNTRALFFSAEPLLEDLGGLDLAGIYQVIVGGECYSKARPLEPARVDRIHQQCKTAELSKLIEAADSVCDRGQGKPELVVLRRLSVS